MKKITDILSTSNKDVVTFNEIRKQLKLSKRRFYPRLKIIKKHFSNNKEFKWSIKRGKFVKLNLDSIKILKKL